MYIREKMLDRLTMRILCGLLDECHKPSHCDYTMSSLDSMESHMTSHIFQYNQIFLVIDWS